VISFAPMAVGELLAKFPRERTWLLPALQAVQRAERYLSPEALEAVAAYLRVPKRGVWGVASHHPELRLALPGPRVVRVCTGVSCKLRGGGELLAACERRLGLRAGQTTADGAVTLEAMDCAFACAVAPVVEIDHACHGRVTPRTLDALLAARLAAHAATATPGVAPPPRPTTGSPAARFAALRREAERRRTGARLAVGLGTCGRAVGARETFEALRLEVKRRGLPFAVVAAGCNGMCWAQPVVEVLRDGRPRLTTGPVAAEHVSRLLNALAATPTGSSRPRCAPRTPPAPRVPSSISTGRPTFRPSASASPWRRQASGGSSASASSDPTSRSTSSYAAAPAASSWARKPRSSSRSKAIARCPARARPSPSRRGSGAS